MNRYDLLSSKLLSEKDYSVKLNDIAYDKVGDDSKFLIDSENCRQAVFSPQGSSSLPQYVMLFSMLAWVLRFGLFAFADPAGGLWMIVLSCIIYGMAFDF